MRSDLQQRLAFEFMRLGAAGWLGLVLLLLAGGYFASLQAPQVQAEVELASELADLRQRLAAQQPRSVQGKAEVAPIEAFYQAMPREHELPAIIKALQKQAASDQVSLGRRDYRYEEFVRDRFLQSAAETKSGETAKPAAGQPLPGPHGLIREVSILVSAQGEYLDLRAFLAHALQRHPYLAIDELKLRREHIDSAEVEASLRLTLFFRKAP
jgi:hypothetical protein